MHSNKRMILLLILIHMDSLTTVEAWYESEVATSTHSLFYACVAQARNFLASDVYRVDLFPGDLVLHLSNNLLLILLLSQKDNFWNLLRLNHCHGLLSHSG